MAGFFIPAHFGADDDSLMTWSSRNADIRVGTLTLLRTFLQPAASLPRAFLFSANASQASVGILRKRPPWPWP